MRIWFDTEFIEDGKTIELISIGAVRADGMQYYAESLECDLSRAGEWVQKNVLPHLDGQKTARKVIAQELVSFAGENPEFWAYFGSYDWVALCQLFGTMMDLPSNWPMWVRDLQQIRDGRTLPLQTGTTHNALADAIWTKAAWEYLQ